MNREPVVRPVLWFCHFLSTLVLFSLLKNIKSLSSPLLVAQVLEPRQGCFDILTTLHNLQSTNCERQKHWAVFRLVILSIYLVFSKSKRNKSLFSSKYWQIPAVRKGKISDWMVSSIDKKFFWQNCINRRRKEQKWTWVLQMYEAAR